MRGSSCQNCFQLHADGLDSSSPPLPLTDDVLHRGIGGFAAPPPLGRPVTVAVADGGTVPLLRRALTPWRRAGRAIRPLLLLLLPTNAVRGICHTAAARHARHHPHHRPRRRRRPRCPGAADADTTVLVGRWILHCPFCNRPFRREGLLSVCEWQAEKVLILPGADAHSRCSCGGGARARALLHALALRRLAAAAVVLWWGIVAMISGGAPVCGGPAALRSPGRSCGFSRRG